MLQILHLHNPQHESHEAREEEDQKERIVVSLFESSNSISGEMVDGASQGVFERVDATSSDPRVAGASPGRLAAPSFSETLASK